MWPKVLIASISLLGLLLSPAAVGSEKQSIIQPIALILLEANQDEFKDLAHADPPYQRYLYAYRGLALLERKTPFPILVTYAYNTQKDQLVKMYLNFEDIVGLQITSENITLE